MTVARRALQEFPLTAGRSAHGHEGFRGVLPYLDGMVDLYHSTYGHFTEDVLAAIRKETFGMDIGQDSWLTVDEYDGFLSWLQLAADHHAIDIGSGSGGPALYLA